MIKGSSWLRIALTLLPVVAASEATAATVQRSVAAPCIGAVPVTVTLSVTVPAGAPDANVLVTDALPVGWTLQNPSLAPGGSGIDPGTHQFTVGWLLAPVAKSPDHDTTTTITYDAVPPASVAGAGVFSGNSRTADGNPGTPPAVTIGGTSSISCSPAPVQVTRTLPSTCLVGRGNSVTEAIVVSGPVGGQTVSNVKVVENLPAAWDASDGQPNPSAGAASDVVTWNIAASGFSGGHANVSYKATPPGIANGSYNFDGSAKFTLSPSGKTGVVPVGGGGTLNCSGKPPRIKGQLKLVQNKTTGAGTLQFALKNPTIGTGIGTGPGAGPSSQLTVTYNGLSGVLDMPAGANWSISNGKLRYRGAPITDLQVKEKKQVKIKATSLGGLDLGAALANPTGPAVVKIAVTNGAASYLYCMAFPTVSDKGRPALKYRNSSASATLTSRYGVMSPCQ